MADSEISGLPAAAALDGSEIVPIVQGGETVQTTAQDIADLGGGGGAVKIAHARILADGTVQAGAVGIASCTVQFGGQYDIQFEPGFFSVEPTTIASVDIQGGSVRCNVEDSANTDSGCRVYVYDVDGDLTAGIINVACFGA